MFLQASVCSQGGGGVCLSAWWDTTPQSRHPPRTRHPLGADTPPNSRHPPGNRHPLEQTPPGADTPRSRHSLEQTPPGADTPLGADPPGADTPRSRHPPEADPPKRRPLLRMVRIILECILVSLQKFQNSSRHIRLQLVSISLSCSNCNLI